MPVTNEERDAIIEECIRAVLTLREGVSDPPRRCPECDYELEERPVETLTGAACFRIMLLQSTHAKLRAELTVIDSGERHMTGGVDPVVGSGRD